MGRGLSQQQKDILAVLPPFSDDLDCVDAPTRSDIVKLLGLDFTPSNRASVSRAVKRLYARGLILHVWGFGRRETQRNIFNAERTGYARATPEQVKARKEAQAAFLAQYQTAT